MIRIGLVGNPNSGKTTIFNVLTGSRQYVGNWPGVTVAKKEGRIGNDILITDLPGIYSLSPYSKEEIITRDYILSNQVDVIINIIDGTNLERNLYLTTQILEMQIPTIVALNMMDEVEKREIKINVDALSKQLGVLVVPISAKKNHGLKELINKAIEVVKEKQRPSLNIYSLELGFVLEKIQSVAQCSFFEAIKLMESDKNILEKYNNEEVFQIVQNYETKRNEDGESMIASERYRYSEQLKTKVLVSKKKIKKTTSEKIDGLLTNKYLALPIFALIMFFIYYTAITLIGSSVVGLTEQFFNWLGNALSNWLISIESPNWLLDLAVNGIIGGVGSVISFLPQLFVLFLFLTILEDSGYMSRVAFIMDRMFRKFGLSGKSFIPMLLGTGCSVPAIMSSRTISNENEQKMTVMLVPFIPCGAKLPVFALFVGTFFHPLVSASLYFLGIFVVIIVGMILKKTKYFKGEASPFILELVDYHLPNPKSVLLQVWERTKSFLLKAGTIIFLASVIIWFFSSFSWSMQMVDNPSDSILANIGRLISWVFIPLGFGNWQSAVALMVGTIAKENIVSTFGIVLNAGDSQQNLMAAIRILFQQEQAAAFSFIVFVLLSAPCVAAIAATKKELNTWKLTFITIAMQTMIAYLVSLTIYQVGTLWISSNTFKVIVVIGVIALFLLFVILYLLKKRKELLCIGCSSTNCDSCKTQKR